MALDRTRRIGRTRARAWRPRPVAAAIGVGLSLAATAASAHPDDYIDETFVYQTVEARELEVELWGELRGGNGQDTSGLYTGALEMGVTERWMIDSALQLRQDGDGAALERVRGETRLRFADEGAWPIDVAVSLEYELERAGGATEHMLTPRLVLSRDVVDGFNTTVNIDAPVEVAPDRSLGFAYAIGVRYPAQGLVRVGGEWKQEPDADHATLFPQVWLALPHEVMTKIGLGIGFGDADPRFTARVAVEIEL